MAAKKGTKPPAAGRGRKRGVPNKTTGAAREVFTQFVERNAEKAQTLFDRIARKNPAKALELLTKLAEFVVPKLQRTEVKASVKMPQPPQFGISFVDGGPGQPGTPEQVYRRMIIPQWGSHVDASGDSGLDEKGNPLEAGSDADAGVET